MEFPLEVFTIISQEDTIDFEHCDILFECIAEEFVNFLHILKYDENQNYKTQIKIFLQIIQLLFNDDACEEILMKMRSMSTEVLDDA